MKFVSLLIFGRFSAASGVETISSTSISNDYLNHASNSSTSGASVRSNPFWAEAFNQFGTCNNLVLDFHSSLSVPLRAVAQCNQHRRRWADYPIERNHKTDDGAQDGIRKRSIRKFRWHWKAFEEGKVAIAAYHERKRLERAKHETSHDISGKNLLWEMWRNSQWTK